MARSYNQKDTEGVTFSLSVGRIWPMGCQLAHTALDHSTTEAVYCSDFEEVALFVQPTLSRPPLSSLTVATKAVGHNVQKEEVVCELYTRWAKDLGQSPRAHSINGTLRHAIEYPQVFPTPTTRLEPHGHGIEYPQNEVAWERFPSKLGLVSFLRTCTGRATHPLYCLDRSTVHVIEAVRDELTSIHSAKENCKKRPAEFSSDSEDRVTRFPRVDSSSESVDVEGLSSGSDLPLMRGESSQGSDDESEGFQTVRPRRRGKAGNTRKLPGGNPNHLGGSSGDESEDGGGLGQGAPALTKGEKRRKPKGKNASRASPQPGTSGSGPAPKAKGKIPPIILCDVEDYSKVARAIRTKVREPVEAVRQPGDRVRLQCGSEEDYRALQKFLPSLGIQHWSYELGRERLVRVVVKGLLTRTSPDDIQEELAEMGFPVKSVSQMLSQWKRDQRTGERQRLPNFVVSLTPGEQTARLYSISVLCGLRVKVEKYKSPGGPVQCKNCFRFGHVRRDCRANPRCGFCGGDHERGGCPEERRSPPKCLHCSGAHSSAWRGCPTYKSLRAAGTVRASKVSEGRTDGLSEGQKPSGHVAVRKVTVTPAPKPKPLVQSFASALSGRPTPPSQAEAPAKATLPEPVASGSSLSVEDPSKTAPLPIPSRPTPAPRTTLPKPLHPSNPFLPLPTPTPVNPATPTPNPTPEDDATKLKICIELLKEIPGLDPWDFSSSLLRKVQESPRSNLHPNRGPPVLKELTVALWNANGVAGKKAELESFLAKHRVDVMLLGETHLRSAVRFSLAEFICHRSDRAGDVGRGGTAVLVRRGLDHHVVSLPPLQHMEATAIQLGALEHAFESGELLPLLARVMDTIPSICKHQWEAPVSPIGQGQAAVEERAICLTLSPSPPSPYLPPRLTLPELPSVTPRLPLLEHPSVPPRLTLPEHTRLPLSYPRVSDHDVSVVNYINQLPSNPKGWITTST
uniref:CCHC-type domain-containing protein n=1 Tax=Timema bartmani TaxID=61472 RepID=A0A7R9ERB3_9NEOP|nr:unnamed protein product [Timema bartmani]